ncbi:xylanolytic transcriptional activator xlnR [Fusarium globosum]|uniref:Xylanolytic transcriptional activator xlnR n=1 Tax=Fusarium globosum TaxID=78864 RepID=A0A8H5Y590_9HYPO|nr:xylanolytic transcriptional activator xlnR [Fusarium globosum]
MDNLHALAADGSKQHVFISGLRETGRGSDPFADQLEVPTPRREDSTDYPRTENAAREELISSGDDIPNQSSTWSGEENSAQSNDTPPGNLTSNPGDSAIDIEGHTQVEQLTPMHHNEDSTTHLHPGTHATVTSLYEAFALGLDIQTAQYILSQVFDQSGRLGIFAILSHLPPDLSPTSLLNQSEGQPRELALMLLAVGLQLNFVWLPIDVQYSLELLIDTLRIESLKLMPMLAWKSSDINVSQTMSLLLASHTWCLQSDMAEIACRWNAIAGLIWHDLVRMGNLDTLQRNVLARVGKAIELQNAVLSMLHYKPPTASAGFQSLPGDLQHEVLSPGWIGGASPTNMPTDFFSLFMPLVQPLQKVITSPHDSSALDEIRDELEAYFIRFPTTLLEYECLEHAYQAEAMIWFHGIFMLTFFLVLTSSVVTCLALREFDGSLGSHEVMATMPPTLLASADRHLRALETFMKGTRFDVELIKHTQTCLSSSVMLGSPGSSSDYNRTLDELAFYRWASGGHGILRSPKQPVVESSQFMNRYPIHSRSLQDRTSAIERLCSPNARICQPGYFEFSIQLF